MPVRVGKLTVRTIQRGAAHDAGFRVRTESLLRSLDLQPPGLPGRTILVVRRIELAAIDGTTGQCARTAIAEASRVAVRPAAGPVAASAGAVVFGDEVELLVCLTSDLVHGVAHRRWYWRQVDPVVSGGGGSALAAAWTSRVRWLPAALPRLPEPEARSAVSLLSTSEASGVLRALLAEFGVSERRSPRWPANPLTSTGSIDPPGPASGGRRPADPPWRRWLPATTLRPHAEALLGVALSLHHAPGLVRRPAYAERLAVWWSSADEAAGQTARPGGAPRPRAASRELPTRGVPPAETPRAGARSGEAPSPDAPPRATQGTDSPPTRAGPLAPRPPARAAPTHAATAADTTAPASSGALGEAPAAKPDDAARSPALDRRRASGSQAHRPVPGEPAGNSDAADLSSSMSEAGGIATALASLLFLVNFVVWLDTEEDSPLPTGWALVELLGRHLLGAQLGDFADDPLWDVLAELDGRRPGTPPDVELEAAAALRLPRAWLRRWPPDRTYVARWDSERLVVRHLEAGFVVADVPCPAHRVDEVAAAEAARLEDADVIVDGSVTGAAPTPERRFTEAVGAFVSWLLRSRGIAVASLMSPGLVRVTSTHIDVVLSLEDVDLAVRVAGLDRDPGWVALLGRIVLFHFLETP